MKIKSKFLNLSPGMVLVCFIMLAVTSCSNTTEEFVEPDEHNATVEEEITLRPKDLATIRISDDLIVHFRSEEDGVVFEADYGSERSVGILDSILLQSKLGLFMTLTDDSTKVPEDLLLIEEDQNLIDLAKRRGIVEQHTRELYSVDISSLPNSYLTLGTVCVGPPDYWDVNSIEFYSRSFTNYLVGDPGTTIYGSTKINGNKCKTIDLLILNCNNMVGDESVSIKTWYKFFNKYIFRNEIVAAPSETKYWSKTYCFRKYRKVTIKGTGFNRFAGTVTFSDY